MRTVYYDCYQRSHLITPKEVILLKEIHNKCQLLIKGLFDYTLALDKPFTRTKRFGFRVFGYKVSTLDSEFITFQIHDKIGTFLYVHVLCVNTNKKPVLKHS